MAKKKVAKRRPLRRAARSDGTGAAAPAPAPKPLRDLHFDPLNPRFGRSAGQFRSEVQILDFIVAEFGVEDVLSSLAVNGYFHAEPLIGTEMDGGGVRILEGNRRLAACLILSGDPRAKNQALRSQRYRALHERHGSKPVEPVPVAVFQESDRPYFAPYLGVRHIAGAKAWDSYAKAAWVAKTVHETGADLSDIAEMIGDQENLTRRMLQAYYLVEQLIQAARFDPEQSHKRGRGSQSDFPFSWVYTILGHQPVVQWLDLPRDPAPDPLSHEALDRGELLFQWMFGQQGRPPAIQESRELGRLAKAIASSNERRLLAAESTITVDEVEQRTMPAERFVDDALTKALRLLQDAYARLGSEPLGEEGARQHLELANRLRTIVGNLFRKLRDTAYPDDAPGD